MIRLTTVGTGTVTPHANRTSACHWVEVMSGGRDGGRSGVGAVGGFPSRLPDSSSVRILMDCGAGSLHGLAKCGLPWMSITHVAITHFHADHWGELAALIFAMKWGALEPRSAPLPIIGPVGMRDKLDKLAAAFGEWVTEPGFPLEVIEITPEDAGAPRPVTLGKGIELTAHKTPHTDESLAYSVATSDTRLVYTGDTGPSDELGDWARDCDLLLAECSLPESMAIDMHLTPKRAGALAARANAKRLVLTHLYPPVEAVNITAEARAVYGGTITIARDGDVFDVR